MAQVTKSNNHIKERKTVDRKNMDSSSSRMPTDLLIALILVILTFVFTLVPSFSNLPLRVPLGLIMVLFLPGYTLIAALFPCKDDLDGIERVALSFGLSIAVVPLVGLGLNYTPWGIRLAPVMVSLTILTMALVVVSYIRREKLDPEERFSVPFKQGLSSLKRELSTEQKSRIDKALTILLIISIIASISVLIYVIITPKQGEKFTEFYILGPGGMAYDYPTSVVAGDVSTAIVGVVNHEYCNVNYTLKLLFDNSSIYEDLLKLDHNQTWESPLSYVLEVPGDQKKLEFLLYKEDNFTVPYRDLHLWVNVTETSTTMAKRP